MPRKPIEVSRAEARRIAVRAQLLDGSASGILDTARRLGFLQLDPIATIAPPQHLVLFSRLGATYDRTELDRLLWEEKQLFEWNAFLWPRESLPIIQARMRRRGNARGLWAQRVADFLRENASFRRYLLRELRDRGPLLSRDLSADLVRQWNSNETWWGTRNVSLILEMLHRRGEIAVVGRRGGQRVWGLAEDWYPETERISATEADRRFAEQRFRALGVRYDRSNDRWFAHPDAVDGPVPDRVTLLSPFDRLVHDRDRTEALWGFRTGSKCTYRRRNANTGTTYCRFSSAISLPAAPNPSSTARPAPCISSAPGATHHALTRPLVNSAPGWGQSRSLASNRLLSGAAQPYPSRGADCTTRVAD